jgi:HAD superfamily hydrolase (TIGR01484 family)
MRDDLLIAYVSGRHLELVLEGIQQHGLPAPSVIVSDVGTSIHIRRRGHWEPDEGYAHRMREKMGCPASAVINALSGLSPLRLQEASRQSDYKISYYTEPTVDHKALSARIRERLDPKGIRAHAIFSVDPGQETGLLDLLPEGVGKDTAVRHLQQEFAVPERQVIYAGDSGNDRRVFESGIQSVVVANTPVELKEELSILRDTQNLPLYVAERPATEGVLEGCAHFGLLPD